MKYFVIAVLFISLQIKVNYSMGSDNKIKYQPRLNNLLTKKNNLQQVRCQNSKWKNVYAPSRLQIIDSCVIVTGVISSTKSEKDGDEHLLLKLDSGQEQMLNKKNYKKKSNELVIEVVCANSSVLKLAKKACNGYLNNIQLPVIGSHVKVYGSYVIDLHNGWTEIHPVTRIDKLY